MDPKYGGNWLCRVFRSVRADRQVTAAIILNHADTPSPSDPFGRPTTSSGFIVQD